MSDNTSYEKIAKKYSGSMGEKGDFYHRTQIDPYIYDIVGKVEGKKIYDIGCGNGYMARHFAKNGAEVWASDTSEGLIDMAKKKSKDLGIKCLVNDATDFDNYKPKSFDVIVMSMVIHYVEDLDKLLSGINKLLKNGGIFVFSNHHFLRPNYPYSEWVKGKLYGKEKLFIKVTDYLVDKKIRGKCWLDDKLDLFVYDHPLNVVVNKMVENNLYIFRIEEPEPIGMASAFSEKLQKSHHIPTFIIIGAKKVKGGVL